MGVVLLFFAAGLLGDAVQNMQQLGWLPFGTMPLWNTSHFLSEDSTLGDILHSFLGYAESPTLLQSLLYIAYLLTAGAIFMHLTRKPPMAKAVQAAPMSTSASTGVRSGTLRGRV